MQGEARSRAAAAGLSTSRPLLETESGSRFLLGDVERQVFSDHRELGREESKKPRLLRRGVHKRIRIKDPQLGR